MASFVAYLAKLRRAGVVTNVHPDEYDAHHWSPDRSCFADRVSRRWNMMKDFEQTAECRANRLLAYWRRDKEPQ